MTEDFKSVVTRLRREGALSLEEVGYRARQWAAAHPVNGNGKRGGVSLSLVQKRLSPGSSEQASPRLLEALSAALEVPPGVFVEYRMASARRLFDERRREDGGLGFRQAADNLAAFEAVFGEASFDDEQLGPTPP